MPERPLDQISDDELRRSFYHAGSEFFSWNAGKNTPNILLQLSGRIEALQVRMKEAADAIEGLRETAKTASEASGKLSRALNRFTLALVIVGAIGVIVQAIYVYVYLHNK